uniref:Enamelin n=1 Tax=Steinernema glaseri TaxID=37863 RepID=A0A1I7YUX0_9BILA
MIFLVPLLLLQLCLAVSVVMCSAKPKKPDTASVDEDLLKLQQQSASKLEPAIAAATQSSELKPSQPQAAASTSVAAKPVSSNEENIGNVKKNGEKEGEKTADAAKKDPSSPMEEKKKEVEAKKDEKEKQNSEKKHDEKTDRSKKGKDDEDMTCGSIPSIKKMSPADKGAPNGQRPSMANDNDGSQPPIGNGQEQKPQMRNAHHVPVGNGNGQQPPRRVYGCRIVQTKATKRTAGGKSIWPPPPTSQGNVTKTKATKRSAGGKIIWPPSTTSQGNVAKDMRTAYQNYGFTTPNYGPPEDYPPGEPLNTPLSSSNAFRGQEIRPKLAPKAENRQQNAPRQPYGPYLGEPSSSFQRQPGNDINRQPMYQPFSEMNRQYNNPPQIDQRNYHRINDLVKRNQNQAVQQHGASMIRNQLQPMASYTYPRYVHQPPYPPGTSGIMQHEANPVQSMPENNENSNPETAEKKIFVYDDGYVLSRENDKKFFGQFFEMNERLDNLFETATGYD